MKCELPAWMCRSAGEVASPGTRLLKLTVSTGSGYLSVVSRQSHRDFFAFEAQKYIFRLAILNCQRVNQISISRLNPSVIETRMRPPRRGPPDAYTSTYTGYGMKGRSAGLRAAPRFFPRCTRIAWADIIRRIAEDGRLVVSRRACSSSRRCRGRRV